MSYWALYPSPMYLLSSLLMLKEAPIVLGGMPSLTVGCLIPAYNEEETLTATLDSLKKQSRNLDQIIVVDDCSTDKTGKIAERYGVEVFRTSKNTGSKARAENAALKMVTTDLVLTLDADTVLDKHAVRKIIQPFSDPKVKAACGFIMNRTSDSTWGKGRFIEYLFGQSLFKRAQTALSTPLVLSGCFSIFRTATLLEYGGLPEYTMAEDMDLTWMMLMNNEKLCFVEDAYAYPLDPESFETYKKQVERWYRAFMQNLKRHMPNFSKSIKLGSLAIYNLFEGLIFPLFLGLALLFSLYNPIALPLFILSDLILLLIPTLWRGWKLKKIKKCLMSIPNYYVNRFVNIYLFYKSFFKEMVLRDKLEIWEKGH